MGSRPWPFGVTWRRRSRDHWTHNVQFPIGSRQYGVSYRWWIWTSRLSHSFSDITLQRYWGHDLDLSDSHDVIGLVTIGLARYGFLLVVCMNRPCISCDCWDIELQRFSGHDPDLFASHDVISHVTIRLLICSFLLVVLWNHRSVLHRFWDIVCPTLSKHIPIENALIPIFVFFGAAKLWVTAFYLFIYLFKIFSSTQKTQ